MSGEPQFEPLGIGDDELRRRMQDGLVPSELVARASRWLAQRDQEERLRRDAFQASQAETASRAADAAERAAFEAERANKKDATARVIAIASIVISIVMGVISVWIAHRDAMHG